MRTIGLTATGLSLSLLCVALTYGSAQSHLREVGVEEAQSVYGGQICGSRFYVSDFCAYNEFDEPLKGVQVCPACWAYFSEKPGNIYLVQITNEPCHTSCGKMCGGMWTINMRYEMGPDCTF